MVAPARNDTFNIIPLLPAPEPSDSDDVIVSLQTARALQKKGDLREALRWLRRAADAAERNGSDTRAVTLARAAAELTSLVGTADAPAASASGANATSASPSTQPAEPNAMPHSSATKRSLPPPLPTTANRGAKPSVMPPRSSLPPPLPKVAPSLPPHPLSATPPPPQVSGPMPQPKPAPRVAGAVPPPATSEASHVAKLVAERPGVRVSVKRSVRDGNLLVVRKLDAGKTAPVGSQEAFLSFADPAADPFGTPGHGGKS